MRKLIWVFLLLPLAAARAELPAQIQRILTAYGISEDDVSIFVQPIGGAEPVLSHRPDVPRNPASVMKLVTTWTALEILGPAYVWPTEVHYLGDFDGNHLRGDLALKGFGDPYLVLEEFWKLLRAVRQTGLQGIDGNLLLDDTYFDVAETDPGAFDGQPFRTYNVIPNALLVNFKAVHFQFIPEATTGRVNIISDPVLNNLAIDNRLRLADGPCGGYQRGISFNATDPDSIDQIVFDGRFPRRCNRYGLSRTVLQHDTYTLGLFDNLWAEMGGAFEGGVGSTAIPEERNPELVWRSRPLSEVIRSINKNSNNVMTRQLLYTLGAEQFGLPGRRENGVEAVHNLLAGRGWDVSSLNLENGAGLSREGSVSVRLLANILLAAERSPYAAEYISSLSLAGLDGTTRGRFDNRSGSGQMHVKTGRIDHVSALAGYLHSAEGLDYVVAVIMNSELAHRGPGRELEEAVAAWVRALN